jgi:hypothetical protein
MNICRFGGPVDLLLTAAALPLAFAQDSAIQRGKGIDQETIAAYAKLGGAYGGWIGNNFGLQEGEESAKEGLTGFKFARGTFPKTKLPEVAVPFALDLDKSDVTDVTIKGLAHLKNLTILNLTDTGISNAGLKELAGLTNLTKLYLDGTWVSDDGIKRLAGLKSLTRLYLDETSVTDEGLKELAPLQHLTTLGLYRAPITDEGLRAYPNKGTGTSKTRSQSPYSDRL